MLKIGGLFHDRYRVVRAIKSGGSGAVYEVTDEVTSRRRALKVMLPLTGYEAALRKRFAQEATITGRIESEHIVQVLDAGIDATSNRPFIVMDLLRGSDLHNLLEKRGPLPPPDVLVYLSHVARALEKTHAAGIVHRDLKPENLFLTVRDDGSPCVKILDFGLAKAVVQGSLAERTATVGTPLYMAPEQIRGDGAIGPRGDSYALGHVAFTLLVGEPYWAPEARFTVSVFALWNKILNGLIEPATVRAARRGVTLPPAFDGWFAKMTALLPADRPASAHLAITALAEAWGRPAPSPSERPAKGEPLSTRGEPLSARGDHLAREKNGDVQGERAGHLRRSKAASALRAKQGELARVLRKVKASGASVKRAMEDFVSPFAPTLQAETLVAPVPVAVAPAPGAQAAVAPAPVAPEGAESPRSEKRQGRQKAEESSPLFKDELTQVYSERYLKIRVEQEYFRARKSGARLAVLVFALEAQGRGAKEEVSGTEAPVVRLATALRRCAPRSVLLGRHSREAISLLVPGAGATRLRALVKVLGQRVEELLGKRKGKPSARVLVGVARLEKSDTSGQALLARAERAMTVWDA